MISSPIQVAGDFIIPDLADKSLMPVSSRENLHASA
jgi:hypothetical protein